MRGRLGGGSPRSDENGDTAAPMPHVFRSPCELAGPYAAQEWCDVGKTISLWRGHWDTDGNGHLVFVRRDRVTTIYGVPLDKLLAHETPCTAKQANLTNTPRVRKRQARLYRIVRWLRYHPDSTKWDVAKQFKKPNGEYISTATAWHDLNLLKQQKFHFL